MKTIYSLLEVIIIILPILLSVAFITIAERKTMGSMQRRVGPNAVGFYGLLQPFADALKLLVKETIIPNQANKVLFFVGPQITLIFGLLGWMVIPFGPGLAMSDINLGILYTLAISSLGVYGILIAGWSANSKYAFLGSLRSTAQMISYELILSSIILVVILFTGSLNLTTIVESQRNMWFVLPMLPLFIMFLIGSLAETNRTPFDLPEAESELVAGFMTEHSASIFVMFFLAEYANIILMSGLMTILFFGGYLLPNCIHNIISEIPFIHNAIINGSLNGLVFGLKTSIIIFIFIWVRASLPRIRFDQLISFGWTILLPLVFGFISLYLCVIYSFDIIPLNSPIIIHIFL